MKRRIRRHTGVADDILGIAAYIASDSLSAALRFIDAVETTTTWLSRNPGAGHLRDFEDPRLATVR